MKFALAALAVFLLATPKSPQGAPNPVGSIICQSNMGDFEAYGTGIAGDPISFVGMGLPPLEFARLIIGDVYGYYHIPFTSGWVCMDTNYMWGHDVKMIWGSGWVGWAYMNPPFGQPGQTLYFQSWYRLPYGSSAFSDAVEITFQ
jgi:hypothetical protein